MIQISQYCGDSQNHNIPLVIDSVSYSFTAGDVLIFTAKNSIKDPDSQAVIQKQLGAGLTVVGSMAGIDIIYEDTNGHEGGELVFDIQLQRANGQIKTLAFGKLELMPDVTNNFGTSIPVNTTLPPLPVGLKGDKGDKGDKGEVGPPGLVDHLTLQTLETKTGATNKANEAINLSKKTWPYLVMNVQYTGVETSLTAPSAGIVLAALNAEQPIFRFISNAMNMRGYPVQDSFYGSFSGGTLSNLITTRNI